MTRNLVVLAGSLLVLVWASDVFVDGAAKLARRLRMSTVLVGVFIIGFGTSAPELVVSILAILEDGARGTELAIGNVVGSNVANLTLVLAIPVLLPQWGAVELKPDQAKAETWISFAAVSVFAVTVYLVSKEIIRDKPEAIGWGAGLLVVLVYVLWKVLPKFGSKWGGRESGEDDGGPFGDWARTLVGMAVTVGSAHYLVQSATSIAEKLGWTSGFVGFALIAVGTSLPELVTSLAAIRRNESGLVIGNLLGSNLLNSLGVGGAILVTHGLEVGALESVSLNVPSVGLMALVSFFFVVFLLLHSKDEITVPEGWVLLLLYLGIFVYMATTATG